jgi:hypothetical protein
VAVEAEMHKARKIGLILAVMVVLSLLGASAASAKTETIQETQQLAIYPKLGSEEASNGAICLDSSQTPGLGIQNGNGVTFCFTAWTGRWIMTYLREGEGHWVTKCMLYVPDFIDNEDDAQAWRWSDEYVADHCSLDDEPQTWQGIYLYTEKETFRKCVHAIMTLRMAGPEGF